MSTNAMEASVLSRILFSSTNKFLVSSAKVKAMFSGFRKLSDADDGKEIRLEFSNDKASAGYVEFNQAFNFIINGIQMCMYRYKGYNTGSKIDDLITINSD